MARANWRRAREACSPELLAGGEKGYAALMARVTDDPDIAYRMVADIYDEMRAERDRANGQVRMGRRPRRDPVPLREVLDTVFGKSVSMQPFPDALGELLAGRSQRAFARRVPCHHTYLGKLIGGRAEPTLAMIEAIADAAEVDPVYFREWRAYSVGQLIIDVLLAQPNASVGVVALVRQEVAA